MFLAKSASEAGNKKDKQQNLKIERILNPKENFFARINLYLKKTVKSMDNAPEFLEPIFTVTEANERPGADGEQE